MISLADIKHVCVTKYRKAGRLNPLELDGETADGHERALERQSIRTRNVPLHEILTKLLFSQQTALALHELPDPTPTTVMGEQSRPRATVVSCRTTPITERIAEPAAESA